MLKQFFQGIKQRKMIENSTFGWLQNPFNLDLFSGLLTVRYLVGVQVNKRHYHTVMLVGLKVKNPQIF